MIRSFKHKGLERFFLKGAKAGIQAQHAERLRLILGRLNVSVAPQDMNLPGLMLHPLTGNRKGTWVVKVSGNWRVTFTFVGGHVTHVDYEDYH
ncbi:MAG: type II toxin-antitoxin system RelE/ParE family toxin [Gammaproteobacteria bacterium]|nr:type II toxin-antitoxin system RelE/ParE family toxin [Gammaproteobacteria bacterium]